MASLIPLVKKIVKVADEKIGRDIVALDVRRQSSIAEAFVFVGATSHLHVQALEDAIREALGNDGIRPIRTDGHRGHLWRAIDYGNVIVHIMEEKLREYYGIERLWEQGKKIPISGDKKTPKVHTTKKSPKRPKKKK